MFLAKFQKSSFCTQKQGSILHSNAAKSSKTTYFFKFNLKSTVISSECSGFSGRVVALVAHDTGCNRYLVQAPGLNKEKQPKEPLVLDEVQLAHAHTDPFDEPSEIGVEFNFALKDHVKCQHSTFEGKIRACVAYYSINRYSIQPLGLDENGEPFEPYMLNEHELTLVQKSPPQAPPPSDIKSRGGPAKTSQYHHVEKLPIIL